MYEIKRSSTDITCRYIGGILCLIGGFFIFIQDDERSITGLGILCLGAYLLFTAIRESSNPTLIATADYQGINFEDIGYFTWDEIAYCKMSSSLDISYHDATFTFNDGRQYTIYLSDLGINYRHFRREINECAGRNIFI